MYIISAHPVGMIAQESMTDPQGGVGGVFLFFILTKRMNDMRHVQD